MKFSYIEKVTTENTGGGSMVDFVHLDDGRIIALNDEIACLYESINDFYNDTGDKCKASMNILKEGKK
jgi:hypothetical protein